MTTETEPNTLLNGGDPPGRWQKGSVSGSHISYKLPKGVSAGHIEPEEDEVVELVLLMSCRSDERGDIWELRAVAHSPEDVAILQPNRKGSPIGEARGAEAAGEYAAEWMEEHDD